MAVQLVDADSSSDAAQGPRDDDGIIGVTEYWNEVRYQVDRERQVGEQEDESYPNARGLVLVGRNTAQQPQQVRQQPQRHSEHAAFGSAYGERRHEHEPRHA